MRDITNKTETNISPTVETPAEQSKDSLELPKLESGVHSVVETICQKNAEFVLAEYVSHGRSLFSIGAWLDGQANRHASIFFYSVSDKAALWNSLIAGIVESGFDSPVKLSATTIPRSSSSTARDCIIVDMIRVEGDSDSVFFWENVQECVGGAIDSAELLWVKESNEKQYSISLYRNISSETKYDYNEINFCAEYLKSPKFTELLEYSISGTAPDASFPAGWLMQRIATLFRVI